MFVFFFVFLPIKTNILFSLLEVVLEELPVASPPQPRELNKEEWSKISRQREAGLRELRMFLRDATNKLLAERKLKEFGKPVNPEEVSILKSHPAYAFSYFLPFKTC